MGENLSIAVIAGGFCILGSMVTGFFTFFSSVKTKETELYKRRLIRTYNDIIAFHKLEEKYIQVLATEEKSAQAWKREIRKALREEGCDSPSKDATALEAERRLKELN
jgi:hypothetical protein